MKKVALILSILKLFIFNSFANTNGVNVNEIDRIFKITKDLKDIETTISNLEKNGIQEITKTKPTAIKENLYIQYLNDYAYFLSETDRYQEAIPILKKVILISPERVVAYLNLGDCYLKDYEKNKIESTKDKVIENYISYINLLKEGAKLPNRVKEFTNYTINKYKDSMQKKINIGPFSFNFGESFVKQQEEYGDNKKYIFYSKKMDDSYKSYYMLVKSIKDPNIQDKESILTYIEKTYGLTNEIKIDLLPYKNFNGKEMKFKKLIKIRKNNVSYYIIYLMNSVYLIESNQNELENELFGSDFENLYYYKYQVDCGGKDIATIEKTYENGQNSDLNYSITQDKLKNKFSVQIINKDYDYNLTLKDMNNNIILNSKISDFYPDKMLFFIDKNKDGYIDIGLLSDINTHQILYTLYIWTPAKKVFEKQNGLYEYDIYGEEGPILTKLSIYGYKKDGTPVYNIESDDYYIEEFINYYLSNLKNYINNNEFDTISDKYLISENIMKKMKTISNDIQSNKGKVEEISYNLDSYDYVDNYYNIKISIAYNIKTGKTYKKISTIANIKFDIVYGYGSPIIDYAEKKLSVIDK